MPDSHTKKRSHVHRSPCYIHGDTFLPCDIPTNCNWGFTCRSRKITIEACILKLLFTRVSNPREEDEGNIMFNKKRLWHLVLCTYLHSLSNFFFEEIPYSSNEPVMTVLFVGFQNEVDLILTNLFTQPKSTIEEALPYFDSFSNSYSEGRKIRRQQKKNRLVHHFHHTSRETIMQHTSRSLLILPGEQE